MAWKWSEEVVKAAADLMEDYVRSGQSEAKAAQWTLAQLWRRFGHPGNPGSQRAPRSWKTVRTWFRRVPQPYQDLGFTTTTVREYEEQPRSLDLGGISEKGSLSPARPGTERMFAAGINLVKMKSFELEGDLFGVGVEEADPAIREGDHVSIFDDKGLLAGGVAAVGGRFITSRGLAVKTRHRLRDRAA